MTKRKRITTQAIIVERFKEAQEKNTNADYRPWLIIQDVPSHGRTLRISSMTAKIAQPIAITKVS